MQELGKFNFKINVIPNRLEKYMSFNINNKFIFIDKFQFLSFYYRKNFKYLSQEFGSEVLNLVKQKEFYLYEYTSGIEKFTERLPSKERFYSLVRRKQICAKEYEHVFKVFDRLKIKKMKYYRNIIKYRHVFVL